MKEAVSGTILIVDDDEVDRESIARSIRKCRSDIRLIEAHNGKEALALVSVDRPDLVIMDIEMPMLNGKETLVALKQNRALSSIPVVMMSTSTSDADVEYCYQNHANAYLSKTLGRQTSDLAKLLEFWFGAVVRGTSPD